ncbi:hypothetical protein K435DRAFT_776582 [Dendrothele bispora CBS 962.96]|uniref:N-acetyltransferase domain-containing protein n=1 Tax=Dendrothele bispora (strain CBS 962.96) TaxID=1314807 RepID=A0A4S8MCW3_DENBC|nr:hypothetical protein K435DRAFT_776582 [Dendrothele bispora CBS 962.96]
MENKITVHHIQECSDDQVQELVTICTRAFAGDFTHEVILGGNRTIAQDYFAAIIRAGLDGGQIYGVKNDEGKVVAFGIWFPPGTRLFQRKEQLELGYNDFFAKLTPDYQDWNKHAWSDIAKYRDETLFTQEEAARRWWCSHLSTDPDYQGQGFGKAIVKEVFEKAKAANQLIALMTEPDDNVKKYRRMGFIERGKCKVSTPMSKDLVMHILSAGSET